MSDLQERAEKAWGKWRDPTNINHNDWAYTAFLAGYIAAAQEAEATIERANKLRRAFEDANADLIKKLAELAARHVARS